MTVDFGLGLLGYHGCWEDAAFAERHGFASAGVADSPLLGGEPFAVLARIAAATSSVRLGTFLVVPGGRSAAVTAQGIATVNRMAPGRTFLGLGTGNTARAVFGLPPVSSATMREYAERCRALLDGREATHPEGQQPRPVRFRQRRGDYIDLEHRVPVFLGADGPRALAVAGAVGDGWVVTLKYADVMRDAADVFARSRRELAAAAAAAGRAFDGTPNMLSNTLCVLRPRERPTSPRALERVGPYAMLPFHAYADHPEAGDSMPPAIKARLPVYRREVLDRFGVPADRLHQEAHRGHLSHLLPGEAAVLTDEVVRMTTFTGPADEIAEVICELAVAGMTNLSLWAPPHQTRELVLEVEEQVAPLVERASV
jgi:alkanesulfonate monooxygenase SsuD/methylene tetrahydromethanopterin reductase-like flavin-dependent oxidoreductase (luciferase family)